jgi:hypothetical protein
MPVICLVQHYIKLILLMVVCPVVERQSKFSSLIRCGTTEKVAMQWPPWSYGFMPLPFLPLTSGASSVFMYVQSYFGN